MLKVIPASYYHRSSLEIPKGFLWSGFMYELKCYNSPDNLIQNTLSHIFMYSILIKERKTLKPLILIPLIVWIGLISTQVCRT